MVFVCLLRTFTLVTLLASFSVMGNDLAVHRLPNGFPRCVENIEGRNLFFKWSRKSLTRVIRYIFSDSPCTRRSIRQRGWRILDERTRSLLNEDLRFELSQIEKKANELREEKTVSEFIERRNITRFTRELNRDLTPRFGPIFATEVFKELIEKNGRNRDFRKFVLEELAKREESSEPFAEYRERVKLVVSFGLGWSDDYGKAAPYYIKDFLSDIASMGLEVVYLDKNPFGTIDSNVARITPQLEEELREEKSVILLSLCKGTPELLSALKDIDPALRSKISGHVNLSGMLTGTFFADIARSVTLPKLLSPFMKIIPIKEIKDIARMTDASSFMKSTVVAETLSDVRGVTPENMLTVNVTGAPLSDRVLKNGSPMGPVLKYNYSQKFLISANDGFIELPHTLIPEELAPNQVTLVLDASHMLSDGYLDQYSLSDRSTRRRIYESILRFILKEN